MRKKTKKEIKMNFSPIDVLKLCQDNIENWSRMTNEDKNKIISVNFYRMEALGLVQIVHPDIEV